MIVHILLRGLPLCGFSREVPAKWPRGHKWAPYSDIDDPPWSLPDGDRWCEHCAKSQARREERYEPPFDPSDCGGAFDGTNVTSDADPGL